MFYFEYRKEQIIKNKYLYRSLRSLLYIQQIFHLKKNKILNSIQSFQFNKNSNAQKVNIMIYTLNRTTQSNKINFTIKTKTILKYIYNYYIDYLIEIGIQI